MLLPQPKQQIACVRSFGRPVTELAALQKAIFTFACRAAEKLRKQGSHAWVLMVLNRTSSFRERGA